MAANPSIQLGTDGNWAIKEDNLLAYKKDGDRFFNKEFDFTRGSFATFVDKDGLIKVSGLQVTNLVNNGDFSELGSELVTNGNFDTDSDWTKDSGWSIENGQAICNGVGINSLQQSGITTTGKFYKLTFDIISKSSDDFLIISTNFGDTYVNGSSTSLGTNTFYINTTSGTGIRFRVADGTTLTIDNVSVKQVDPNDYWTLGTGWSFGEDKAIFNGGTDANLSSSVNVVNGKSYKYNFTIADMNTGSLSFRLGSSSTNDLRVTSNGYYSGQAISDGTSILFRAESGFNGSITNISVQEIQTDTPRIDFTDDATGHLLLEPQSTNLITHSEDFSSLNSRSNAVVTSNVIVSPSGVLDADEITFDGTLIGRVEQTISAIVGQSYTISLYLKNKDLSDKTQVWIGFSGAAQGQFVTITDEWQRYSITVPADGTSEYPRIQFSGTGSLYAWGFQVEQLTYATSYIPTFGSTATRNAEVCNNSGSVQDFNSEEGVLYAEIANLSSSGGDGYLSLSSDDGTQNNRATIRFTATTNNLACQYVIGAVNQTSMDNILTDRTEFNKIAFLYSLNNFVVFVNGVKLSTDTSGSVLPNGTFKKLTFNNGIVASMYAKTKNLKVFKRAMSDGELYLLTVPQYQSYQEMATALNYTL